LNTDMFSQMAVAGIFGTIWEWIKIALGWVMEGCYYVLEKCGIESLAACIILFTIVIYSILLPLQIKNAKFQKLNSVMSPEIQAISKKYQNKTDNESRMKQQQELSAIYEKYGVSPTGGCLQSFIQLPILFAVYRVLYNVPDYVKSISNYFTDLVNSVVDVIKTDYAEVFTKIAESSNNTLLSSAIKNLKDSNPVEKLPNLFYQFRSTDWDKFASEFPDISESIESTREVLESVNNFFGVSIAETPKLLISNNWDIKNYGAVAIAILIPVLSGFFQWLSSKVVSSNTKTQQEGMGDTAAALNSSMKTMLYIMPIFSVYICYTLPLGIGLYWTMSAVYRTISQLFINKAMNKTSVEKLIEKNQEKINKKRAKKGLPPKQVTNSAHINTKNIKSTPVAVNKDIEEIKKTASDGTKTYTSIRDKANMVSDYNERNNKKK